MLKILKFHRKKFLFLYLFFFARMGYCYIPSTSMILDRVLQNGYAQPIYLEQEVELSQGSEKIRLIENWWVDGKGQIAILVQGEGELKNQLVMRIEITSQTQTFYYPNEKKAYKISSEFVEPLWMAKNKDQLKSFLISNDVLPKNSSSLLDKNSNHFINLGKNEGFKYQPEPWVMLARTHGTTAWRFFNPNQNLDNSASLWIEQDHFRILKFKNSNGVVYRFYKHTPFFKQAKLPTNSTYVFGNSEADILILKAKPLKSAPPFTKFQQAKAKQSEVYLNHPLKNLIQEFYLRFR